MSALDNLLNAVKRDQSITIDFLARAELAQLRAERDAWREYARHQEGCAVCGESVSDCEIGSELMNKAYSLSAHPAPPEPQP